MLVAIAAAINTRPNSYAYPTHRNVTPAEVDELLRAAAEANWPGVLRLRGFGFEPPFRQSEYPRFQVYQATWDNVGGSVNAGFYALDPLTLDVWDGVMCQEIKSPKLKALQRTIRARIGLHAAEYKKIRVTGPQC